MFALLIYFRFFLQGEFKMGENVRYGMAMSVKLREEEFNMELCFQRQEDDSLPY